MNSTFPSLDDEYERNLGDTFFNISSPHEEYKQQTENVNFNFELPQETFNNLYWQNNSCQPVFSHTFGSGYYPYEVKHQVVKKSYTHHNNIHSIKAFTKFCNLSTPTVMKWLDGHQVYKSSVNKINIALSRCNITKDDLLKMRRTTKKPKSLQGVSFSFSDEKKNNPILPSKDTQNKIEFVVGHIVNTNADINPKDTVVYYQVVYTDLGTGWVLSNDLKNDREIKLVLEYWESQKCI
jgi:hypothetical protein